MNDSFQRIIELINSSDACRCIGILSSPLEAFWDALRCSEMLLLLPSFHPHPHILKMIQWFLTVEWTRIRDLRIFRCQDLKMPRFFEPIRDYSRSFEIIRDHLRSFEIIWDDVVCGSDPGSCHCNCYKNRRATYVISASLLHESLLVMSLDLFKSSSWFLDDTLSGRNTCFLKILSSTDS